MADADAGDWCGCGSTSRGDVEGELTVGWARAPLLAFAIASTSEAQTWRTLDVSRQLRDTSGHHIRVRYAAGRFSMRPTTDPVLFSMQVRYDEERTRPIHQYDPESRSATLGVEGQSIRWTRHLKDDNVGEMRLGLSSQVPLDLELELGATQARVDAGGLSLSNLRIETGAADAVLDFSAPNRTRMRHLDIQLGAAGFVITNLGNANVSSIRVQGGVGSVDLDFGGSIQQDVNVEANVALGKLTLHLPRDIGVRVEVQKLLASFDHSGLYKRGNAYYSDNWDTAKVRMRVRAETVFGAIEIDRDR
jgi:hypothetical protein